MFIAMVYLRNNGFWFLLFPWDLTYTSLCRIHIVPGLFVTIQRNNQISKLNKILRTIHFFRQAKNYEFKCTAC